MKVKLLALAVGLCLLNACSKGKTVEEIEPGRSIMRDCETGAVIASDGYTFEECVGKTPQPEEEESDRCQDQRQCS